jgi:hypothetical protein
MQAVRRRFAGESYTMDVFLEKHSSEMMTLVLAAMVLATLLVIVPQLLKSHHRSLEMQHAEHLRSLEAGQKPAPFDIRSRAAGRAAALVPIVAVISGAAVTCFLVVYKPDYTFAVSVAVWAVVGVVSLAAITGGVALMGRLAQLDAGEPDEGDEDIGAKRQR